MALRSAPFAGTATINTKNMNNTTEIESTQEYQRHAVGKAILNLSPEDKSEPDVRGALDWLRSIQWEVAIPEPTGPLVELDEITGSIVPL